MKKVVDSCEYVFNNSKNVSVDTKHINNFVKDFKPQEVFFQDIVKDFVFNSFTQKLNFIFVFSWMNFAYWNKVKWEFNLHGEYHGSTWGFLLALKTYLNKNPEFLSNQYIQSLDYQSFTKIFQGRGELLLDERYELLKYCANVFEKEFDFDLRNILKKCDYDALCLVDLLVKKFPKAFNDKVNYNKKEIYFYKKAQVLLSYIDNLDIDNYSIKNVDKLTAFADYRLPQALRQYGILQYDTSLAKKVDNLEFIEYGSDEEVEIRANTVIAVERLKVEIKAQYDYEISAREIDNMLWNYARNNSHVMKPHHRTVSVFY